MEQRKIEHTIVDIDSVQTHPKNVRQGDIGAISESLKAHGQYRPIVVDKRTNHILAGNHTWKAAKTLGWTQINAGFIETKNDDEAIRILLADNRTTDIAAYDDAELVDLLKGLAETDEGLLGTAFDGDALDDLVRIVEGGMHGALDALDEWKNMPDYDQEDKLSAFRTTVHFGSEKDADLFFEIIKRPKKSSFWYPKDDGLIGSNVKEQYISEE